eukprot:gene24567-biopygen1389
MCSVGSVAGAGVAGIFRGVGQGSRRFPWRGRGSRRFPWRGPGALAHSVAFRGCCWLGLAWLGLAWLGLAWLGLAWLGLATTVLPPFVPPITCLGVSHLPVSSHTLIQACNPDDQVPL